MIMPINEQARNRFIDVSIDKRERRCLDRPFQAPIPMPRAVITCGHSRSELDSLWYSKSMSFMKRQAERGFFSATAGACETFGDPIYPQRRPRLPSIIGHCRRKYRLQ
jgi:hypothetical protein